MSEASNRNPRTASPPLACASWVIRSMTSFRLSDKFLVMPLSSPPARDLNVAPSWEPILRLRTVTPNTSPSTSVTSYPGMSFIVETSMEYHHSRCRSARLPTTVAASATMVVHREFQHGELAQAGSSAEV